MIVKDDRLKMPNWNRVVWRYMDLAKFLDLVTTQELFFANASKLTDKFEGVLPLGNIDRIRKKMVNKHGLSNEEAIEVAKEQAERIKAFKDFTLVNCWSMGSEESYALWKIYLGMSTSGVAIRTNAKNLMNSIISDERIYIGEVSYTNFITEEPHVTNVFTRKSPYYKYEQELRLFIPNQLIATGNKDKDSGREIKVAKHPNGMKVSVDIDVLIDEIYISPFVGDWFEKVLRETLQRLRPSLVPRIMRSSIQDS